MRELTVGMHRRLLVVGVQVEDGDRAELPRRVHVHVGLPPHPLLLLRVILGEHHGARVALAAVAEGAAQAAELAAAAGARSGEAAGAEILPAQHPAHGPAAQHLAQSGPQAAAPDARGAALPLLEPVVAQPEQPPARGGGAGRPAATPATPVARVAAGTVSSPAGEICRARKPAIGVRSEERRVGKECLSVCRSRWSPYH